MQSKTIITLLIGLFLLTTVTESFSQRRSSRDRTTRDRDREQVETVPFTDKLAFDILIGNPSFGNPFQFSGKLGVGYKITDKFTVGLGTKYRYVLLNEPGTNDLSALDYGFFVYPRYALGEQFYIKGEYNYFSARCPGDAISFACLSGNLERQTAAFPMLGAGFAQGYGKWKFGIELMLGIGNQARDTYSFLEYMISFIHNL